MSYLFKLSSSVHRTPKICKLTLSGLNVNRQLSHCMVNVHRLSPVRSQVLVSRFQSTSANNNETIEKIAQQMLDKNTSEINLENFIVPDPPPMYDFSKLLNAPITTDELNLTSWFPTGIFYNSMDYMHSCGLPWFATIIGTAFLVRCAILPLTIKSQKKAAHVKAMAPYMLEFQKRYKQLMLTGSQLEKNEFMLGNKKMMESMEFKELQKSQLGVMAMPFVQGILFSSFFITARAMTNHPIESLKNGGILWFTDLSQPDPYYALPALSALTLHLVLKKGVDFGTTSMNPSMPVKIFTMALPVVIFGFMFSCPTAVTVYMFSNNILSLGQVYLLNRPRIRKLFNLPEIVKQVDPPTTKSKFQFKNMFSGIKQKWREYQLENNIATLEEQNYKAFKNAGIGPLKKTFKINPKQN